MPRVRRVVAQAQATSSKRTSKIHSDMTRVAMLTGLVPWCCGARKLVVVGLIPVGIDNLDGSHLLSLLCWAV